MSPTAARFLAASFVFAAALAGCTSDSSSNSANSAAGGTADGTPAAAGASPGGPVTIGVSIQNREAQFYQDMEAGMKSQADKYGYTLVVVDASRDNSKQQSQVENFISQKVSAIVLTPYDSKAIGSAIVEANKAGIPVFTADIANGSNDGIVVAHIASDNVQGGAQAGMLMCQAVPKDAEIAIIDEPEVTSVQDRVKGFRESIAANCGGVKIVQDSDGGGERARASSVTEDLLQSHPNLKGIFGINDDSALGAAKAVVAAGKKGQIAIVGYDATPEARTAIGAGDMYGDAIQHPDQIGVKTIDAVRNSLNGIKPEAVIHVPVGTFTKKDADRQ
jgi:ribose transport system substrate-binding protein